MSLIASAVKLAPLQTSGELIRNVQDSPTKHIDAKLKGSITRLVRKERKKITKIQLEGVTIDNTIGSLAALSKSLWFERYWCCPIKGRWLLANGGIAITGNNQGLESTWRWDCMAISQGYQVWGIWEKNGAVWEKNMAVWTN